MAIAILPHEDYLRPRFGRETGGLLANPSHKNSFPNPNAIKPKASSNNLPNKRRRKRSRNNRRQSDSMVVKAPVKNLVMGQVKILKRGETLIAAAEKINSEQIPGSKFSEDSDLILGSTNRLGPDPETMQNQIKLKESKISKIPYAGYGCIASPSPSSVPVPGFLVKTISAAI